MTDYKELIGDIKVCLIAHPSQTLYKRLLREAADAIEQLVKERDAAIVDLKDHGRNCKTCLHGRRGKNDCLDREEVPCKWEWRGVQKESE